MNFDLDNRELPPHKVKSEFIRFICSQLSQRYEELVDFQHRVEALFGRKVYFDPDFRINSNHSSTLCHISRNATHHVNFSFENSVDMSVEVLPSLLQVPSPLLCGNFSRTPRKVVNL